MTYYRTTHADGFSHTGQNKANAIRNAIQMGAVKVERWNVETAGERVIESLVKVVWENVRPGTISRAESNRQSVERIEAAKPAPDDVPAVLDGCDCSYCRGERGAK